MDDDLPQVAFQGRPAWLGRRGDGEPFGLFIAIEDEDLRGLPADGLGALLAANRTVPVVLNMQPATPSPPTPVGRDVAILSQFIDLESERVMAQIYQALPYGLVDSMEDLERALDGLVNDGALRRVFRVYSPFDDMTGIEDFDDRESIPSEMEDDWQEPPTMFEVGESSIRTIYKLCG